LGRKLSQDEIESIRQFYREGRSERWIAAKVHVGLGTVSNYTAGLTAQRPILDKEHKLRGKLRKHGHTLPKNLSGVAVIQAMHEFDVTDEELPLVFEAYKETKARPADFAKHVLKLKEYEQQTGKTYGDVIADYETKWRQTQELEQRDQLLLSEIQKGEARLQNIQKLATLQAMLQSQHVTPDRVIDFVDRHVKLEELGFTLETAQILGAELRKIASDPALAASRLAQLFARDRELLVAIREEEKLKSELEPTVKGLENSVIILESDSVRLVAKLNQIYRGQKEAEEQYRNTTEKLDEQRKKLEQEILVKKSELDTLVKEVEPRLKTADSEFLLGMKRLSASTVFEVFVELILSPETFIPKSTEAVQLTYAVCRGFRTYVDTHRGNFLLAQDLIQNVDALVRRLSPEVA